MPASPCSVIDHPQTPLERHLLDRIVDLERRLAATGRALERAQAEIALLNDRLAWAEADLAVVECDPGRALRPTA